ncbi:MAG: DinB family protein [Actinomycetota bacterium]
MSRVVASEPPHIPNNGDERVLLLAFLQFYRAALLDRAAGLDAEQLRRPLAPSRLTLIGLIGHMTYVEYIWFRTRLTGEAMPEVYDTLDWDADRDAEMTRAEAMAPEAVVAEYRAAVREADDRIAAADLDTVSVERPDGEEPWDVRWIVIHMIEEYARHCGHADIIRESIDGGVAS